MKTLPVKFSEVKSEDPYVFLGESVYHGYPGGYPSRTRRLLRMGQEILETGQVIVRRPDADELLGIRNGTHSYEDIVEWASDKDKLIREVLYHESKLPKNSNRRLAEELILNVQDAAWSQ